MIKERINIHLTIFGLFYTTKEIKSIIKIERIL